MWLFRGSETYKVYLISCDNYERGASKKHLLDIENDDEDAKRIRAQSKDSLGINQTEAEKKKLIKGAPVKLKTRVSKKVDLETEALLDKRNQMAPESIVKRRKVNLKKSSKFVIPKDLEPRAERKHRIKYLALSMKLGLEGWAARHESGFFSEDFAISQAEHNSVYGSLKDVRYLKAKEAYREGVADRGWRASNTTLSATYALDAVETTLREVTTSQLRRKEKDGARLGEFFLQRLTGDYRSWRRQVPEARQCLNESK